MSEEYGSKSEPTQMKPLRFMILEIHQTIENDLKIFMH